MPVVDLAAPSKRMNASPSAADFPWSESEIRARVRDAVREMWGARVEQALKTAAKGTVQTQGTRSEVTGGKHLDSLLDIVCDLAMRAGYTAREVIRGNGIELPGFYRPTKKWDLVIARRGRLCAAIELKSQVGSFGNNLNNRTEEALGNSVDIWRAFKAGSLGPNEPFVGYFALVQDAPAANSPVGFREGLFKVDPVFKGASYTGRYVTLCERMVQERNYTAAALLLANRDSVGDFREPSESLTASRFLRQLYGHLLTARV